MIELEALHCNARGRPVGISNVKARHGDDVVARARALHAEGMGYRSIGQALGVARSTVQSWIGKSGNPRRAVKAVRVIVRRKKA